MKIGFVSLGCSKNLVDTEMMIGLFKNHHFTISNRPEDSNIIVVNTCGFIESAKEEAINTILEMAEYKKANCKVLIVTGCLVQRYQKELEKAIPEVDLFLNLQDYDDIWNKVKPILEEKVAMPKEERAKESLLYEQRVISTGENFAYLKIAEGCSNHCTYCAIPSIRGPYISRKKENILKEAEKLAKAGIKELIVIAQDTTKYGIDLYGEPMLASLLQSLAKIEKIKWIRFLYAYPETITDELIQVVKENKKICHYFDIPMQHVSNPVLKRMNRKSKEESIRKLLQKIRKEIPDVIVRTTFIVGFPGETKEDFEKLYAFAGQEKFDRMGAFIYSKEEGTPAAKLEEQIHYATKKSRYCKLMELQKKIVEENSSKLIGKELEILVEAINFDHTYYIARSYGEVPDIDGLIYVKNENKKEDISLGSFKKCRITGIKDYDLLAEFV